MNNLRTPPLSSCKNLPPYFFMVHLLHRLYGVDAPDRLTTVYAREPFRNGRTDCDAVLDVESWGPTSHVV